jgi:hypothetical protein
VDEEAEAVVFEGAPGSRPLLGRLIAPGAGLSVRNVAVCECAHCDCECGESRARQDRASTLNP